MKRVLLLLDDESGKLLEERAREEYRSVKATAEKIVLDSLHVRSDGLTDSKYVKLAQEARR